MFVFKEVFFLFSHSAQGSTQYTKVHNGWPINASRINSTSLGKTMLLAVDTV